MSATKSRLLSTSHANTHKHFPLQQPSSVPFFVLSSLSQEPRWSRSDAHKPATSTGQQPPQAINHHNRFLGCWSGRAQFSGGVQNRSSRRRSIFMLRRVYFQAVSDPETSFPHPHLLSDTVSVNLEPVWDQVAQITVRVRDV